MTKDDELRERQTAYFTALKRYGVPDALACEVAQILIGDSTPLDRTAYEKQLIEQAYQYIQTSNPS